MSQNLIHLMDGDVVLYRRERSSRYQARIKMSNNRWKRISTKKSNVDDAGKIASDYYLEAKFRAKHHMSLQTKKFKDIAEMTIKEMKEELAAGYGLKTYESYWTALQRYHIPFFSEINIDTIDFRKLSAFDKFRTNKMGRIPSKSTINTHNSALNRVFTMALNNDFINQYQIPKLVNKGVKVERREYFDGEEYAILYKHMRKWHKTGRKQRTRDIRELMRDYVLILTNTGMRPGTESNNLRWKDIKEVKIKDKKYLEFEVKGKTGKKRQLIARDTERHSVKRPLERIQERFEDLKDLSFSELLKIDRLVFRTRDGKQMKDPYGAFRHLLKSCKLLKDEDPRNRKTLYSLRHTYATFQILNGIGIYDLAVQMGTSVVMIEKHYSHLRPRLIAEKLSGRAKEHIDEVKI